MKKTLSLALVAGLAASVCGTALGQTYSSGSIGVAINDTPTVQHTINVSGGPLIGDIDVRINLTHTYDGDLDIVLIPPGGLEYVHLVSDVGGTGENMIDTVFDQDASDSITTAVAPMTGSWIPEGGVIAWIGTIPLPQTALANLDDLDGRSSNGDWTLMIDDDAGLDVGVLNEWAIIVTSLGGSTNPRGTATLTPNSGPEATPVVATVTVTPGQFPLSSGVTVSMNASAVGAGTVTLLDNGAVPDVIAGDNVFTGQFTIGSGIGFGPQPLDFTVQDAQGRSGVGSTTFTVRPPAAPNDRCEGAEEIPNSSFPYASGPAYLSGNAPDVEQPMSCAAGNATNANSSVWYRFVAPTTTNYRFSTSFALATGNNIPDTVLTVYESSDGTCGSLFEVACDDDAGDGFQSDVSATLNAGTVYYIQVAKWALVLPTDLQTLGLWVDQPVTPPTGTMTLTPNSGFEGTTFVAEVVVTPGGNPTSSGIAVNVDANGVFGGSVDLRGDGVAPDLIAGDNTFAGTVTVGSFAPTGAQIVTFGVSDAEGRTSSGQATFTVIPIPEGACCQGTLCSVMRQTDCAAAGGTYMGDDAPCSSGDSYSFAGTAGAFEDISSTGSVLTLTDDSNANIPIGFTFPFFGDSFSDCYVGSNGYVTFGAGSIVYVNTAIPAAGLPNNAIYAMWDDLNPGAGGSVSYETRGTSGSDLRLIVQWTNVPQFANTDSNTFQIVLFENGDFDLRYGTVSAFTDADVTIGAENADGTLAGSVPASTVASDSGLRGRFTAGAPACGGSQCFWQTDGCFADYDNNSGIDSDDVIVFFGDWDSGESCADVDGSGGTDSDDVIAFFSAWDAGGIGFPGC